MEHLRRLGYLFNRRRLERELAEEMEFHREMMGAEGIVSFGNTLSLRERARDAWGWRWFDEAWQDLSYGIRILRRSPGFTFTSIVVLALGIGISLSAFQVFNTLVLRPLPVSDPDSLHYFIRGGKGWASSEVPFPAIAHYRENATTLSAVMSESQAELDLAGTVAGPVSARFVSGNYFHELGGMPAHGRVLQPLLDERADAPAVAVLSYSFWRNRLGSDPNVIGKTLRLNRQTAFVAGVASARFTGLSPSPTDLWLPISHQPLFTNSGGELDFSRSAKMYGRLRPGFSIRAAESELASLAAALHGQFPNDIKAGEKLYAEPAGYATILEPRHTRMVTFFAVLVLLVLAVAGSNFGSLLLSRALAREREFGIRASLGAGRSRIARQVLTESLLLCCAGSLVGLWLGLTGCKILLASLEMPPEVQPALDWRTAGLAFVLAVLTALAFGLAPALQASHRKKSRGFARIVMVGAQVAASSVLLIVSGLYLRSIQSVFDGSAGFDFHNVVTVTPSRGLGSATSAAVLAQWRREILDMPGIESAAVCTIAPLGFSRWGGDVAAAGRTADADLNAVEPGYFTAMRIPILRGRNFTSAERDTALISESLARRLWPGQDPIGKQLQIDANDFSIVVGVAGNAHTQNLSNGEAAEVYLPYTGQIRIPFSGAVVVRASTPLAASINAMQTSFERQGSVPPRIRSLEANLNESIEGTRKGARLISLVGVLTLILASAGIGGLLAFSVQQLYREIGIRMALGSPRAAIVRIMLMQLAAPVGLGLLVGALGGAGMAHIMRSQLYGLSQTDPAAFAGALALILLSASLAAYLPLRRALAIDPNVTLRHE